MDLRRTLGCAATSVAVLVALCACTSSGPKRSASPSLTTVVVTASPTPSASTSTPAPGSSTAPPAPATRIRGTCETLLPTVDVEDALGAQLRGTSSFVVGLPEHDIGRLAYINCRYGLLGKNAAPQVEIGVSLYSSPAQAQRRANGTVADYRDHGATEAAATVSGHDGTILIGSAAGYNIPLLVVTSTQRTIAVSVLGRLLPPASRNDILTKIATLAVTRTGG